MNRSETAGGLSGELDYIRDEQALKSFQSLNIKKDGLESLQLFLNKFSEDPTGDMDSLKVDGILGRKTKERLAYFLGMNQAVENADSVYASVLDQIIDQNKERNIIDSLKEIDKDILK